MTTLISILMPLYNKAEHLHETLASIDRQFTASLFRVELVVVDDCSSDDGVEALGRFRWSNDAIAVRLFRNDVNLGPADSYNRAFEESSGDCIVPLDADDLLTRLSLWRRYRALLDSPGTDWVSGNVLVIRHDGRIKPGKEMVLPVAASAEMPADRRRLIRGMIDGSIYIPGGQALMIRRRVLGERRWPRGMRSSQDTALVLGLLAGGYNHLHITDYVAVYRSFSECPERSLLGQSIISGRKAADYRIIKAELGPLLSLEEQELLDGVVRRFETHPSRRETPALE